MNLLIIFIFGFFLRIYLLEELPGEMWGDVIEHYKLTKLIFEKKFFLSYLFGGDGPLISYLNALIGKIFGLSFYSLKLTTAIIGSLMIIINYLIAKELFKKKEISYLSAFLTAVGFWGLTFSRQGKPYILAGILISLAIYFFLKKNYLILGLILGLGVYSQTSFWGIIFLSLINIKTFFIFSFLSLPLFISILKNPVLIFNQGSYLGEKLIGSYNLGLVNYFQGIVFNYYRNFFGLFYQGDKVFRHNIPSSSHLDIFMQIFFIIGGYFFIKNYLFTNFKKNFWVLIFILLIYLPTCLDVKNFFNNPSMGRTVGVIAIFYPIIALGIYEFGKFFKNKIFRFLLLTLILYGIFLINFYKYFYIYPKTLPQENFPLGKLTARIIDNYFENIPLILNDCCWFEWGLPEPNSIIFNLKKKRDYYIKNIDYKDDFFNLIKDKKYFLLVTNPFEEGLDWQKNLSIKDKKTIYSKKKKMIKIFLIKNDLL